MYQQVAPIEVYVKQQRQQQQQQKTKQTKKKKKKKTTHPYLQWTNNHVHISVCIHTDN